MKNIIKNRLNGISLSLRVKIILSFYLFIVAVCSVMAISSYIVLKNKMMKELQGRAENIVSLGSQILDKDAIISLSRKISPKLSEKETASAEGTAEFRKISAQLNRIRDTEKDLIKYVYLIRPSRDPKVGHFICDVDTLADLEKKRRGGEVEDEITRFSAEFDGSDFPVYSQAVKERRTMVEKELYFDEVYNVFSFTAYSPVFDGAKKLLGLLCIDITSANIDNALRESRNLSIFIMIFALVLTLPASIVLGNLFTKGILYLEQVVRKFTSRDFTVRSELRANDEIGRLSSSFNFMAETIQKYANDLESLLNAYSRFVPKDFLHFLNKESIVEVKLGEHVEKQMTVLFSDIRSFTTLSESMTPEENFKFINSYLKRFGPIIRKNNGFIDKYIGDAIMALFPGNADDAVSAAVEMMHTLKEYNRHRQSVNYPPIDIGIGIHTGLLMLGTIGEEERMDGSVISDAVNLSSRLEGLTKIYKSSIIISKTTMESLPDPKKFNIRFVDKLRVKGKKKAVSIYEVFSADSPEIIEQKKKHNNRFAEAIRLFSRGNFRESLQELTALRSEYSDNLIEFYIARLSRAIEKDSSRR